MGRSVALLLAAAIAAGAISAASAADLLPPPPPIDPGPPPVAEFSGWYLRGDVGVSANQINDLRSTFDNPGNFVPAPFFDAKSIGDSAFAGAGIGYQFNNWLRFDVTGEYRTTANYRSTQSYANLDYGNGPNPNCGLKCYDLYEAQKAAAVFLANAYVDLGTWHGITPYVGGGVGFASHFLENLTDRSGQPAGGFGYASNRNSTTFAWQVGAGLGYNVTPNLKLEVGYRYLDMGRTGSNQIICQNQGNCPLERQSFNITSHDVRLGFRYLLGGEPQPVFAGPAPLVRKF